MHTGYLCLIKDPDKLEEKLYNYSFDTITLKNAEFEGDMIEESYNGALEHYKNELTLISNYENKKLLGIPPTEEETQEYKIIKDRRKNHPFSPRGVKTEDFLDFLLYEYGVYPDKNNQYLGSYYNRLGIYDWCEIGGRWRDSFFVKNPGNIEKPNFHRLDDDIEVKKEIFERNEVFNKSILKVDEIDLDLTRKIKKEIYTHYYYNDNFFNWKEKYTLEEFLEERCSIIFFNFLNIEDLESERDTMLEFEDMYGDDELILQHLKDCYSDYYIVVLDAHS